MDPSCFQSAIANDVAQLSCIPSLVDAAARAFVLFSGVTALILIAWGSIRMIMSGGDAKQVESARRTIVFSIVGLIVVLCSFALVNLVGYITKTSSCVTNIESILTGCQ